MFGKSLPSLPEKVDIKRESEYLLATLSELENMLERLAISIRQDINRPAYVWGGNESIGSVARQQAALAISAMRYKDGQEVSESLDAPGILGIDPAIMDDVRWINKLKHHTQILISRLDVKTNGRKHQHMGRVILSNNGWARIHRKQVYRQIRLLDCSPEYVGFTWAKVRKITRVSGLAARERLMNTERSYLLDLLSDIPDQECLAYVSKMPVHARANVLLKDFNDVARNGFNERDTDKETDQRRIPINTPLPILYPAKIGSALPRYQPLELEKDRSVRPRKRYKLEETPLCLNIYRYKPEHRPCL